MATKKKKKRKRPLPKNAIKLYRFPPGVLKEHRVPKYLTSDDLRLPTIARYMRLDYRDDPDVLPFDDTVRALEPRLKAMVLDPKSDADKLMKVMEVIAPFRKQASDLLKRQYDHIDVQVEQGVQSRAVDLHLEQEQPRGLPTEAGTPEAVAQGQQQEQEELRNLPPEEREKLGSE